MVVVVILFYLLWRLWFFCFAWSKKMSTEELIESKGLRPAYNMMNRFFLIAFIGFLLITIVSEMEN